MANLFLSNFDEVRNMEGTCDCSPKGFRSWRKYWANRAQQDWPKKCRINSCSNKATDGAHVNVLGETDEVYIIPMCKFHNRPSNKEWFEVNSQTVAVPVEREDTNGPEGACFRRSISRKNDLTLTNDDEVQLFGGHHAGFPTGFRSWKKYWVSETNQEWPEKCRIHGCGDPATGGARINVWVMSDEVYIIPMCEYHITPNNAEWLNVNSRTVAVYVE